MDWDAYRLEDTIVAVSTPRGRGAVSIVRLSGRDAVKLARTVVTPLQRSAFPGEPRRMIRARLVQPSDGHLLDDALVVFFRGPASFTGEDVVEFHVHGSPAILQALIMELTNLGARPAQPGEFTYRAFIHGKMDLIQAEALNDLIQADAPENARAALHQLEGDLSRRLGAWRSELLDLVADLEAEIDFGDDEPAPLVSADAVRRRLERLRDESVALAGTYARGRALREGWLVVITGKPNAGKSSLFNALLRTARAIVTDQPGTTRDFLRERILMEGLSVDLVDTAGLSGRPDPIERIGMERARELIQDAHQVLWVLDRSRPLDAEDERIFEWIRNRPTWILVNKVDLEAAWSPETVKKRFPGWETFFISCLRGDGLESLEQRLREEVRAFAEGFRSGAAAVLTNARHYAALQRCRRGLERAVANLDQAAPLPIVVEDLRSVVRELDRLTGRTDVDEILDRIFRRFCIGK